MPKQKIVKGRMIEVPNKDPRTSSNKTHIAIQVEDANGDNEECLLFTPNAIKVARERALKNPEDLTKKSFIRDFLD